MPSEVEPPDELPPEAAGVGAAPATLVALEPVEDPDRAEASCVAIVPGVWKFSSRTRARVVSPRAMAPRFGMNGSPRVCFGLIGCPRGSRTPLRAS